MPEEQITVLAPHSRRAALEREVTRRRAISLGVGGLASLYLAACGGKSGPGGGGGGASEAASLASDAKVEKGPLLLANWPYTYFAIMPTNARLMATPEAEANAETRRMVERWGRLHAGRGALGAASTLVLLWAAFR